MTILSTIELQKVTFHHRSEADLAREVAGNQAVDGRSKAFAGFAFHHYGGYREWVATQGK